MLRSAPSKDVALAWQKGTPFSDAPRRLQLVRGEGAQLNEKDGEVDLTCREALLVVGRGRIESRFILEISTSTAGPPADSLLARLPRLRLPPRGASVERGTDARVQAD